MENNKKHTYIIAEAGVNHNGDETLAHQLVEIAARAGADAVKFQIFSPEAIITNTAPTADYQAKNLADNKISQLEMIKKLCLPDDAFLRLAESCKKYNIDFMCTPFDNGSLAYLVEKTNMPYLKLSSGEVTNAPFLLAAARSEMPMILSTGMASIEEITTALCVIYFGYNNSQGFPTNFTQLTDVMLSDLQDKVSLLHCVSEYPAPIESVNLRAMDTISKIFYLPVGLSDHTLGITMPIAAVSRGAVIIEKHFTYDKSAAGPDHVMSLSPEELKDMVSAIRDVEKSLGTGEKICQSQEKNTRDIARRSIVAAHPIAAGELFSEENLICKRPATGGIMPRYLWNLIGKKAKTSYAMDDFIAKTELE